MAIGAIGRETGTVSPATGDVSAASAADLRLLRGAFRAAGIDLRAGDISYARSTETRFEAEVGLRNGQVVEPWRRADSVLALEMERHPDSGASVNARIVDIASGKILSENRSVWLRPRPPFETSEDIEPQFRALGRALEALLKDKTLVPDLAGGDRRAAPRVVPTSHRDLNLAAQEAAFKELNLRGAPTVAIQDLGESNRLEEALAKAGKGRKPKDGGKEAGKGGQTGKGVDQKQIALALGDLLGSVGGGQGLPAAPGSRVNIKA